MCNPAPKGVQNGCFPQFSVIKNHGSWVWKFCKTAGFFITEDQESGFPIISHYIYVHLVDLSQLHPSTLLIDYQPLIIWLIYPLILISQLNHYLILQNSGHQWSLSQVLLALVDCGVAVFNTVGIVPGSFRVCRVCRPLILMCATKFLRRMLMQSCLCLVGNFREWSTTINHHPSNPQQPIQQPYVKRTSKIVAKYLWANWIQNQYFTNLKWSQAWKFSQIIPVENLAMASKSPT